MRVMTHIHIPHAVRLKLEYAAVWLVWLVIFHTLAIAYGPDDMTGSIGRWTTVSEAQALNILQSNGLRVPTETRGRYLDRMGRADSVISFSKVHDPIGRKSSSKARRRRAVFTAASMGLLGGYRKTSSVPKAKRMGRDGGALSFSQATIMRNVFRGTIRKAKAVVSSARPSDDDHKSCDPDWRSVFTLLPLLILNSLLGAGGTLSKREKLIKCRRSIAPPRESRTTVRHRFALQHVSTAKLHRHDKAEARAMRSAASSHTRSFRWK